MVKTELTKAFGEKAFEERKNNVQHYLHLVTAQAGEVRGKKQDPVHAQVQAVTTAAENFKTAAQFLMKNGDKDGAKYCLAISKCSGSIAKLVASSGTLSMAEAERGPRRELITTVEGTPSPPNEVGLQMDRQLKAIDTVYRQLHSNDSQRAVCEQIARRSHVAKARAFGEWLVGYAAADLTFEDKIFKVPRSFKGIAETAVELSQMKLSGIVPLDGSEEHKRRLYLKYELLASSDELEKLKVANGGHESYKGLIEPVSGSSNPDFGDAVLSFLHPGDRKFKSCVKKRQTSLLIKVKEKQRGLLNFKKDSQYLFYRSIVCAYHTILRSLPMIVMLAHPTGVSFRDARTSGIST